MPEPLASTLAILCAMLAVFFSLPERVPKFELDDDGVFVWTSTVDVEC